jgi:hypothetical protein
MSLHSVPVLSVSVPVTIILHQAAPEWDLCVTSLWSPAWSSGQAPRSCSDGVSPDPWRFKPRGRVYLLPSYHPQPLYPATYHGSPGISEHPGSLVCSCQPPPTNTQSRMDSRTWASLGAGGHWPSPGREAHRSAPGIPSLLTWISALALACPPWPLHTPPEKWRNKAWP